MHHVAQHRPQRTAAGPRAVRSGLLEMRDNLERSL